MSLMVSRARSSESWTRRPSAVLTDELLRWDVLTCLAQFLPPVQPVVHGRGVGHTCLGRRVQLRPAANLYPSGYASPHPVSRSPLAPDPGRGALPVPRR